MENPGVNEVSRTQATTERRGEENLLSIYGRIDERARSIVSSHDWWPCREGCDGCCRSLARLPELTIREWGFLWQGFLQLPAQEQASIRRRVMDLAENIPSEADAPFICPLLDRNRGACLVYEQRPAACRTYGFYVERGSGLWCGIITALLDEHGDDDITWGSQPGIDHALHPPGSHRTGLLEWFAAHPDGSEA